MQNLKGLRTIIANILIGAFAIAAMFGLDVTPEQKADILNGALALAAVINMILRLYTDTPAFSSKPVKKRNGQSGGVIVDFIAFLFSILVTVFLLVLLSGCQTIKESPPIQVASHCIKADQFDNTTMKACVDTLTILVQTADALADQGVISSEVEHKALDIANSAMMAISRIRANGGIYTDNDMAEIYQYISILLDLIPLEKS